VVEAEAINIGVMVVKGDLRRRKWRSDGRLLRHAVKFQRCSSLKLSLFGSVPPQKTYQHNVIGPPWAHPRAAPWAFMPGRQTPRWKWS